MPCSAVWHVHELNRPGPAVFRVWADNEVVRSGLHGWLDDEMKGIYLSICLSLLYPD